MNGINCEDLNTIPDTTPGPTPGPEVKGPTTDISAQRNFNNFSEW